MARPSGKQKNQSKDWFFCSLRFPGRSLCAGFAVEAAVGVALAVGEEEDLVKPRLHCGDAPGVAALEDVDDALRQREVALFHQHAVAYDVDGSVRVDEADDAEVYVLGAVFMMSLRPIFSLGAFLIMATVQSRSPRRSRR